MPQLSGTHRLAQPLQQRRLLARLHAGFGGGFGGGGPGGFGGGGPGGAGGAGGGVADGRAKLPDDASVSLAEAKDSEASGAVQAAILQPLTTEASLWAARSSRRVTGDVGAEAQRNISFYAGYGSEAHRAACAYFESNGTTVGKLAGKISASISDARTAAVAALRTRVDRVVDVTRVGDPACDADCKAIAVGIVTGDIPFKTAILRLGGTPPDTKWQAGRQEGRRTKGTWGALEGASAPDDCVVAMKELDQLLLFWHCDVLGKPVPRAGSFGLGGLARSAKSLAAADRLELLDDVRRVAHTAMRSWRRDPSEPALCWAAHVEAARTESLHKIECFADGKAAGRAGALEMRAEFTTPGFKRSLSEAFDEDATPADSAAAAKRQHRKEKDKARQQRQKLARAGGGGEEAANAAAARAFSASEAGGAKATAAASVGAATPTFLPIDATKPLTFTITRMSAPKDADPLQQSLNAVLDRLHFAASDDPSVRLPCWFAAVKGKCGGDKCRRCKPPFGEPAKPDPKLMKLAKAACDPKILEWIGRDAPFAKL